MLDELKNKIRQIVPFLSLKITAICIYGSYANGAATKDSDIDLLVIANNIAKRRIDRTQDIIKIKGAMALKIPADILLLTEDECIDNFRNHNPLFLDITIGGVIVFDSKDFLKNLIEETGNYIKTRPIIKEKHGWRFPVIDRVTTFLSMISNRDFAKGMFCDAKRDMLVAKKILDEGIYDKAVYHCQQAVEKSVKAVLISFGMFQKIHFVGGILLDEIERHNIENDLKAKLKEAANISIELEPEVTWSRYPGINNGILWLPSDEYSIGDANNAIGKSQKVMDITKEFLEKWFKG